MVILFYIFFACHLSTAEEDCDSQHYSPTCNGECACPEGLECYSGIEGDGYCYCPKQNIVSVESFGGRTFYWRLDTTNQRIYLDQYNATKNLTDLTYYFTWCNKFAFISDLYSNDDHISFQPSNYKMFHNYWLYYNDWHLDIKPDLSNNTVDNSTWELAQEASFVWEQNAWYDSTVAFRSKYYSGLYVMNQNGILTFGHYDGSEKFKRDASFIVHQENPNQIYVEPSRHHLSLYDILGITTGVLISFILIVVGIGWLTRNLIERGRREREYMKNLLRKNLGIAHE